MARQPPVPLHHPEAAVTDTCDCADCRNPAGLLQCEVCGRWRDPDDMADYDDTARVGPLTYCLTDRENCR